MYTPAITLSVSINIFVILVDTSVSVFTVVNIQLKNVSSFGGMELCQTHTCLFLAIVPHIVNNNSGNIRKLYYISQWLKISPKDISSFK